MNDDTEAAFTELFGDPADLLTLSVAVVVIVMAFAVLKTIRNAWSQYQEDDDFTEADIAVVVGRVLILFLFIAYLFI